MHFGKFSFGTLRINGSAYDQDVVIDRGEIRKRKKLGRYVYYHPFWKKPSGARLEIRWRYEQDFIPVVVGPNPK